MSLKTIILKKYINFVAYQFYLDTHIVAPLESRKDINVDKSSEPFIPTSPSELILIAVLCFISLLVLVYTLIMLYRCVCSRNYAEWRAGWSHDMSYVQQDTGIQVCLVCSSL